MKSIIKNKHRSRISIVRYFVLYAAIFTIFTSTIFFYLSQKLYKQKHDSVLKNTTIHIEESLLDGISYTSYIMEYLGKNIKQHNPKDLQYISKLLSFFKNNNRPDIATFRDTLFWSDAKQRIVITSSQGIINPVDVSDRHYIQKSIATPEKTQLGKLLYGKISKEWVIPTAMGIKDKNGEYAGSIIFGFKMKNLQDKISRSIVNKV